MPGEFVTFENAIYKAEECSDIAQTCYKCDLFEKCPHELKFRCSSFAYFKYVATKNSTKKQEDVKEFKKRKIRNDK